ncbi:HAMP domain-containing histidine kinase [Mucilaginibacter sp. BJC16-A38]|uniref:sensor histidine kinase n=1 Tax=Mucilaginibacter phenanthrenivorans TaxID=1234842 RepID=UPI0021577F02|nr:HAMP domain-containing sensor histidine kinase [Mucilaginibacter phenanthrenivorans]MCR8557898.1 HAMP domain-containing histidine kinase [Mucilaginibacter phenanthrenivorans]
MKKRINLVVISMAFCTTFLLCLQLYWNYKAYQSSVKAFKSESNSALSDAVEHLTNMRRDEFAAKYKTWLADTSMVSITCKVNTTYHSTVFTIADKHQKVAGSKSISFSIDTFKQQLSTINNTTKAFIINHFVKTNVYTQLKLKEVYFVTQNLGDSLNNAYKRDRLNRAQLDSLFKVELLKRDINTPHRFYVTNFSVKKFSEVNKPAKGYSFATLAYNYGFSSSQKAISAWFPDPDLVFFRQMKWLLLSSLILIAITVFCFTYTVKTILRQKKLAELKNDFVNNMTHELKTPVATINIAAEAIQDFNLSKASADEYLGIIRHQAGNLTNLIDQILKNVVSEQENINLNLTKVNTGELIGRVIKDYKPQSAAANISVNYNSSDQHLMAVADEPLLKNAIANLLDNAIKYSGNGAVINVNQSTENSSIIIKVSDNGPGIPQQYQDKVFDRFFRVPSGDIHNMKGYGLGLSYAKSIIERHKGSLTLISKEGSGTEFIISIPLIYHEAGQSSVA